MVRVDWIISLTACRRGDSNPHGSPYHPLMLPPSYESPGSFFLSNGCDSAKITHSVDFGRFPSASVEIGSKRATRIFFRRSTLCAGRSGVRLEPFRKLFLIHFTRRKAKRNVRRIYFRRSQAIPAYLQKHVHDHQRNTLVPVDEGTCRGLRIGSSPATRRRKFPREICQYSNGAEGGARTPHFQLRFRSTGFSFLSRKRRMPDPQLVCGSSASCPGRCQWLRLIFR